MFKSKKGITLVALVVTIVVLLILAGVSINLVLGDNGIVKKAQDAKKKAIEDQANMQEGMDSLAGELKEAIGELITTPETAPYFPDNTFKKVEGSIDTGLVIQDDEGNQYVWVVVPRTTEVYKTTGLGKTTFTGEDYTSIEEDLKDYTSAYSEQGYSDTWHTDTNNEGWLTEDEYNTLKNNMLKSIYLNGGFYIGRYEAGIEINGANRTANTDRNSDRKYIKPEINPVTKANVYPYIWVTRTQAQNLAKSLSGGKGYTTSLMFGVQWDLVLAFMSKDTTKITSIDVLIKNSKTIGNYYDNLWDITNTKVKYSIDSGASFTACPYHKTKNESVLLTTGADNIFAVQNIYDIAGNVRVWTLEENSDDSNPCVTRGAYYYTYGASSPAVCHSNYDTSYSIHGIGFRFSLWQI